MIINRLRPRRDSSLQIMTSPLWTLLQQKAELSLGEILGAANGFLYPIVNIQSLVLAKLVDLKPLVLHCLLIAAYSDVSVNHILVVWGE